MAVEQRNHILVTMDGGLTPLISAGYAALLINKFIAIKRNVTGDFWLAHQPTRQFVPQGYNFDPQDFLRAIRNVISGELPQDGRTEEHIKGTPFHLRRYQRVEFKDVDTNVVSYVENLVTIELRGFSRPYEYTIIPATIVDQFEVLFTLNNDQLNLMQELTDDMLTRAQDQVKKFHVSGKIIKP